MKIVPYTAICGGFEEPRTDIKCFTGEGLFREPVMEAKIYKILPHEFLDCDVSIWMDGNIFLNVDPKKLVDEFLGDADMALFKHPISVTVKDEIDNIRRQPRLMGNKRLMDMLDRQERSYAYWGHDELFPVYECGMIIRRNNYDMLDFNALWWSEICSHTERDQVSFPVCAKMKPVMINTIPGNVRNHPYFTYKYSKNH